MGDMFERSGKGEMVIVKGERVGTGVDSDPSM